MKNDQTILKNECPIYLTPVSLKEANDYLARYSRDYRAIPGCKFTIGCARDGRLMGAIIVGRCRGDSLAVQVDGIYAAGGRAAYCMLYGAAARAAKAMGYHRIMAFFPTGEPDSGLRSACWKCVGLASGDYRPTKDPHPQKKLLRYERALAGR